MDDLSKSIKILEQKINYKFKNHFYSSNAITHPSYKKSQFELLEFIGDRVLNLAITKMIWHQNYKSEQTCAEQLATKVNKHTLLEISRIWEIQNYILYKGQKEHIDSILADACEAIIGAVFLDGGWNEAYELIKNSWPTKTMSFIELDPKSVLQKWVHQAAKNHQYNLIEQDGPPHSPKYTVELLVFFRSSKIYKTTGISKSIREAEKNAALEFIKKYTDIPKKK